MGLYFPTRINKLTKFVNKEQKPEEAMYYFVVALTDFIYNLHKKDNLNKYVSSILFYAYQQEIIEEDFFKRYGGVMKYTPIKQSIFYNKDNEEIFRKDSEEFLQWLRSVILFKVRTAPYEDEEDYRGQEENNVENEKGEEDEGEKQDEEVEKLKENLKGVDIDSI